MDNTEKIVSLLADYGLKSYCKDLAMALTVGAEHCLKHTQANRNKFVEHMGKAISYGELGRTLEIVNGEKFKLKTRMTKEWGKVPEWFLVFLSVRYAREEDGFEIYTPFNVAKLRKGKLFEKENQEFFEEIIPEEKHKELRLKYLFSPESAQTEVMPYMMGQMLKMKVVFLQKKALEDFEEKMDALLCEIYEDIVLKLRSKKSI